jgi:chromosome segregation ATPase
MADPLMTKVVEILVENQAKLEVLDGKVGTVLDGFAGLRDGFAGLHDGFAVLKKLHEQTTAAIQELRDVTAELGAAQSRMRSEIMSRIDRLQETVELLRDDARVNWATADTAINRARNAREAIDDLQKQISAMERRYQTLASLVDGLRNPDAKKPDDP